MRIRCVVTALALTVWVVMGCVAPSLVRPARAAGEGAEAKDAKQEEKASAKNEAKPPKEQNYSYIYDVFNHSLVRPITRYVDWPLMGRHAFGHAREAANVDERDEVRLPSTWWQPRIGYHSLSVERLREGSGTKGPAPGRWTIVKAKSQGVTPGFQIKDSNGDRFLLKFDVPDYPELSTGAEAICTRLFWAAGYNVPENVLVTFRPEDLVIDPKATTTDMMGRDKPFTEAKLKATLAAIAIRRDGTIRCIASRFLKGKPLGPFKYIGRRRDDPEDMIPHELRRELRGLWTMAAWTNHADIRGPNSLDMWVTENNRSFVRHYLIDFGSTLGSGGLGPRSYVTGTEVYIDFNIIMRQLGTVGLRPFEWEAIIDPHIPSVGKVESVVFDPDEWLPDYPNPAFDEMTHRDAEWGARIVAAFTDEHIRAAVEEAHYTDPRATEYMTRVLIERRDKIKRAWLGKLPQATAERDGGQVAR
jgi:hypothetical protein